MQPPINQRFTDRLFKSLFSTPFAYQYPSYAIAVQVVPKKGRGYIMPESPNGTAYGQTGQVYTDSVRGIKARF